MNYSITNSITHCVKFKKLMLLTAAFLSVSALSVQAMDESSKPFLTTVGKVRKAHKDGSLLLDESQQPPRPYRVVELIDTLKSVTDEMPAFFDYTSYPPQPTAPLFVMKQNTAQPIYDQGDPSKIVSMIGGGVGIFSAKVSRISPALLEQNTSSSSCSSSYKETVQFVEEPKETIKLSKTTGFQGESSFVGTLEQIRTAFKEGKLLEDPEGRLYRITSLTEKGYVPQDHIVCCSKSQGESQFKTLISVVCMPDFDYTKNPPEYRGSVPAGTFDVRAERVTKSTSVIQVSEKKELPQTITAPTTTAAPTNVLLNTTLSIKEEIKESNKPASKIFKEPDHIQNKSNKTFYTFEDKKAGIHYGFELLTTENTSWWKSRLGACAYLQYKKDADIEIYMRTHTPVSSYTEDNDLFSFLGSRNTDYTPSAFCLTKEELVNMYHFQNYDDQFKKLQEKYGVLSRERDYLDAWKGFKYDLEKPQNCPIWVAYASSKPVEGPLYKNTSITSPDIKRAITVLMGENFYGLLGIFNDPIALADDKEKGNPVPKQQSIPFFSAIATCVKEINPSAKFGLVRPIEIMRRAITKSGIKFSESRGGVQKIDYPYIRYVKDVVYTYDQDKLTEEEKANFGDASYIIVDPRTNDFYQISQNHWFSKNPFLGGMPFETISKYPIVLMDIEDLINYKQ